MPFEELKTRQSAVWGSGPYEPIVEITTEVHDALVEALAPQPGERLLDVATGTGAVALLAARAGAVVTGLDLAPDLVERAREKAAAAGLEVTFEAGDAEALPYADGSFDVVCSAIGTQFAPDHEAIARELARVCRQGGRLGLACWTPESGVGQMFGVMRPFMPPPPEGAGNIFDWGRPEYARRLLEDDFELADRGARHRAARAVGRGGLAALRRQLRADEDARRLTRRRPPRGAPPQLGRVLRAVARRRRDRAVADVPADHRHPPLRRASARAAQSASWAKTRKLGRATGVSWNSGLRQPSSSARCVVGRRRPRRGTSATAAASPRRRRSPAFRASAAREQVEVDLDLVHLLHAPDVRVPPRLVRVDEGTAAREARGRVDDLVAVHLAAAALDLVLGWSGSSAGAVAGAGLPSPLIVSTADGHRRKT